MKQKCNGVGSSTVHCVAYESVMSIIMGSHFYRITLKMKYKNEPCNAKVGKDANACGLRTK